MGVAKVIDTGEIIRLVEFAGYRPHPDRMTWHIPGSRDLEISLVEIVEVTLKLVDQEVGDGS